MSVFKLPGSAIQANTITTTQLLTTVVTQISAGGGPKVKSLIYPGNDTAANTVGGQTVYITGSGFAANAQVLVNGSAVPSQSFISASNISFTTPALSTGTYPVYIINPEDGGTAILYPGLLISGEPTWTTSATLPGVDVSSAWSISLSATGDTPITYALAAGNTLPSGITLSANGLISGTLSSPPGSETTYNFSVIATDVQNQDSTRQFSITASVGDAYFANNVLLIHADGTNNGNNQHFIESSANTLTVTRTGSANQGSYSPFSQTGWSNYFDGNGDYLTTTSSTAFSLGSGDFTIEAWANFNGTTDVNGDAILFIGDSTTNRPLSFYRAATNTFLLDLSTGGSNITQIQADGTIPSGVWMHFAATRSANTINIYFNGVLTKTQSYSSTLASYTGTVYIGRVPWNAPSGDFPGYISNLRVVKGTAVYTSNFTPPTTALTAIANTSLLTCQSNRFIDNSTNALTITKNGDVSIQAFSPLAPTAAYSTANNGGSVYIPSGTNGLTVASVPAIGTGNFTVEGWFWPTDDVVRTEFDSAWCTNAANFNGTDSMQGAVRSNHVMFRSNGTSDITAGISIANRWTHIAWVRNGTTVTIYVNGVSVVSGTYSNSLAAGNLYISRPDSNQFRFNGWISGFRILNTALYTGTFTPPTSAPTAVANTIALLNFTNAQIFDQTAKNIIETVGDAKVSTSVYKYGTGSIAFDGTGDYLTIAANPLLAFGTGDFTVEFWFRGTDGDGNLIGITTNAAGNWNLVLASSSLYWQSQYAQTNLYNRSATGILDGNWHHIAITRASGTSRMFFDGVLQGATVSDSTSYAAAHTMQIGSSGSYGDIAANIDDLRITKGYARYTSNFTPPTSALKDK